MTSDSEHLVLLIDQPYYSHGWFRQCASALIDLEQRRSWFANADAIAAAFIKRSTEVRSGQQKGMSTFFAPEEDLSDEDLLRDVKLEKQISYMEMIQEERRLKLPQTIHPVDLAIFCQMLHIPYLPDKQPATEVFNSESRPTPARKGGTKAAKRR